jgi:hypothetical protein
MRIDTLRKFDEERVVPSQRYQRDLPSSITVVYAALLEAAGKRRWRASAELLKALSSPLKGVEYAWRRGSLLRCGRVLESLPPVALTLQETLHDPPCRVTLRLRCRLEPIESGAALRLEARYDCNGPASLNACGWSKQIRAHCERLLSAVELAVPVQGESGCSGHSTGSSSITVAKTAAVSGTPSLK